MTPVRKFWAVWLAVGVAVELYALRPGAGNRGRFAHAWRAFRDWADNHTWDNLTIKGRTVSTAGAAVSTLTVLFLAWAALHLPQLVPGL